jgi:AAA+ superfamily predicted ATPase
MAFSPRTKAFEQIRGYIMGKYPLTYVVSPEEERAFSIIKEAVQSLINPAPPCYVWSATDALCLDGRTLPDTAQPIDALDFILRLREPAFFIFRDLHPYLDKDPAILRKLRDLYYSLREAGKFVFLVSPALVMPIELRKEVALVELGLPGQDEIAVLVDRFLKKKSGPSPPINLSDEGRRRLIRALQGLTLSESQHVLTKVFYGKSGTDPRLFTAIFEEKAQITRKEGILEFVPQEFNFEDVGGLENLKEWLIKRKDLFAEESKKVESLLPKGLLMMGISGCGKSLSVKAVSSLWNLPLFRLNMNHVYSGVFGTPEEAFNRALLTSEILAPCILWIDEIEMGVAGYQGGEGSAPSQRIFASFLTWMQEKEALVFVAATANRIDLLPAEILRKGRFDQIFFMDLPTDEERKEIFRVHLRKRGVDHNQFDLTILAKGTRGWNGAEIEQCVVSAIIDSVVEKRTLQVSDLYRQMTQIVPLSRTMAEQIKRIKSWAHDRAVPATRHTGPASSSL